MLEYFDAYAARYQPYKGGDWCYEDGCIYRGLLMLHQATGQARWRDHLLRLVLPQVAPDGRLRGYRIDEYNIDNILSGRILFALDRWTDDPRWMAAAGVLARQLDTHPRTESGNYWHKLRYPHQVWLDGLYMALPFQIEYAQTTGDDARRRDALAQMASALAVTLRDDGLYAHGYDAARVQEWADPRTGQSPSIWARALGWQAMALVDCAELVGLAEFENAGLLAPLRGLLGQVIGWQQSDGGWLQLMTMPELAENYTESSASAMFAYAMASAATLGVDVPGQDDAIARVTAFTRARLVRDDSGAVQFGGICHVAGLGGFSGVYRDGSPEYYLSEEQVSDDAKGTGPLMMAHARALQLAQMPSQPVHSLSPSS
ncbi:glycoside hydrolase family 105 protein [Roseinatronobacter sp. S2]|uniref:glycoside hydrolase family 88/105 protein n=1 Tax=Roseinatronobacter sp. S2 TaxID=3035471 RepID=UPI00241059AB|nr:glycoside hydrolase family 88 protein [Roseinatronobacter sp. S2]WFE76824.1 glycoside hydrolase family 88 protein [Roseinatronobacter sp. S2]